MLLGPEQVGRLHTLPPIPLMLEELKRRSGA